MLTETYFYGLSLSLRVVVVVIVRFFPRFLFCFVLVFFYFVVLLLVLTLALPFIIPPLLSQLPIPRPSFCARSHPLEKINRPCPIFFFPKVRFIYTCGAHLWPFSTIRCCSGYDCSRTCATRTRLIQ